MRVVQAVLGLGIAVCAACSAGGDPSETTSSVGPGSGPGSGNGGSTGQGGGAPTCPACDGTVHTDCDGASQDCADEGLICNAALGCAACAPGTRQCADAGTVELCAEDGSGFAVAEECDLDAGLACVGGSCKSACQVAEDQPSNVGCEFWAVDLDQQDGGGNDPASAPWGLALSNAGDGAAVVLIELNQAAVGEPQNLGTVAQVAVPAGSLQQVILPTRELDCGTAPNQYASPGTCLSSRAFRVTSTAPIVVTQFNVFENSYSNDASLLLPTNALGKQYRVIGWNAGHPVPVPQFPQLGVDRSYITVVGTAADTEVTVRPSWKIRGNPPIAATPAGQDIVVTLQPFDVLNLETDDGSFGDDLATIADLSGSSVSATKPVAVFTGVESTQVPGSLEIPTYPGWEEGDTGFLDHLEEQLFPLESVGSSYVVTRSPLRSTSGYREPDVIRFVGAAENATITTTLPAPFASFTLAPGEVKTTWTQGNFTATADKPFMLGQLLISTQYVDGPSIGDPSLTVFPPADQYRGEYIILTPGSWDENWVVISAQTGTTVTIDGSAPAGCIVEPSGTMGGVTYESRACPLAEGIHALSSDTPFGIIAYGYGSAGSYAFVGGADVKKIYEPPPFN